MTWAVCLYTNRKIRVKHEYEQYWALSIEHSAWHALCIFRWLLSIEIKIFADIYEAVVCVYLPTLCCNKKNYYIIVHFNERKKFRIFRLFVELLCAYLATETVGSPKQSSFCKWAVILHTCCVCFVVLLKIVLCLAIDVGSGTTSVRRYSLYDDR